MTAIQPPGWYPDPGNSRLERWWENNTWTPLVRPVLRARDASPACVAEPKPPREPMSTDAKRAIVIAVLAGIVFTAWGYTGLTSGDTGTVPARSMVQQVTP